MLLKDLNIVLKVAKFRSITAAAKNLDMRVATASAAVKRVEKYLGVELFIRTTRQLRLSNAGEKYIPQCERALLLLDQAKQNTQDELEIIEGELRIALSSDLGRNVVTTWLDEFIETHPNLSLKTHISDSKVDFYRDPIDIALRYGSTPDLNSYGFKICDVPRLLCATPDYLSKNGTPKHPKDLSSHNGLFYQLHESVHDVWVFSNLGREYKIKMHGNRASNDGDLVRRACVSGKGLALKSSLDMANDVLTGRIINVMPQFKPTPTELWLICPSRQSITPAVRLLRDTFRKRTAELLKALTKKGIIESNAK